MPRPSLTSRRLALSGLALLCLGLSSPAAWAQPKERAKQRRMTKKERAEAEAQAQAEAEAKAKAEAEAKARAEAEAEAEARLKILESEDPKALTRLKLDDTEESIKQLRQQVKAKTRERARAKLEGDRAALNEELKQLGQSIAQQERAFEMLMIGNLDLTQFDEQKEQLFDWKQTLLDILQPIMGELQEMTAQRRKMEALKARITRYESQQKTIDEALAHIEKVERDALKRKARKRFDKIAKSWEHKREEIQHLLELAKIQLGEMIKAERAREVSVEEKARAFALGRGMTLLMALGASLGIYLFMTLLWRLWGWWLTRRKRRKRRRLQRLIGLSYRVLSGLLSLIAIFYVFNLRGDRALLAIATLLLLGAVWILKTSILSYIDVFKMLMNMGPVREGERLIYAGVPVKVSGLNMFTELRNPMIPDCAFRVPIASLLKMTSRELKRDEDWFPCREGDFVLVDGVYARAARLTLETVTLVTRGGTHHIYTTPEFLGAHPQNLSVGYSVSTIFGVDYDLQGVSLTEVPARLEAGIREGLASEPFGASVVNVTVEFDEAAASSLNYAILVEFDGEAARDYPTTRRALQKHAVAVCNAEGWGIPFQQLVVHKAPEREG